MSHATPNGVQTADVADVPIALVTYESVVEWIDSAIAERRSEYVCVAATHTVMACREDPDLQRAVLGSSMTVPDGMPIVWALKLLGKPLPDRVYGPDLMLKTCEHAATAGHSIFLYGGRDEAALSRLIGALKERYPALEIAGTYKPEYRQLTAAEQAEVAEQINSSGADIVWVGLGVPRQELWMHQMRQQLNAPVLVGVGAAFDLNAGTVKQAPRVLQRIGMEWAYRLSREPRRLWRRYARYNPRFVVAVARQLLRHGRIQH